MNGPIKILAIIAAGLLALPANAEDNKPQPSSPEITQAGEKAIESDTSKEPSKPYPSDTSENPIRANPMVDYCRRHTC